MSKAVDKSPSCFRNLDTWNLSSAIYVPELKNTFRIAEDQSDCHIGGRMTSPSFALALQTKGKIAQIPINLRKLLKYPRQDYNIDSFSASTKQLEIISKL